MSFCRKIKKCLCLNKFYVCLQGCYNRRHRRGCNSSTNSVQNGKSKQRRGSQDGDDVDDDSLAAELLVSTVKNLRCLCAIMLDGVRYDLILDLVPDFN